ncbi:hypothetical protein RRG08_007567 [Elysia crispata]|uniref:Uncharacterized protein n=1 Tax=Elysia crispata TaxID=231223 RepID=A0AAE0Z471_9GAST|nr:hypothetical protein RRG08_007567 [Elysia crispata]
MSHFSGLSILYLARSRLNRRTFQGSLDLKSVRASTFTCALVLVFVNKHAWLEARPNTPPSWEVTGLAWRWILITIPHVTTDDDLPPESSAGFS